MTLQTIVVVHDFAHVNGGAAQVAVSGAIGLAERGLRVIFFAAAGPVDPRLTDAGITVHCLDQSSLLDNANRLQAAWQGIWNVAAAKALQAVLRSLDPRSTVVLLHSWSRALSASIVPTIREGGFRLACTLHDYFIACPNGGFYDFPAGIPCERTPLSLSCITCNCDARRYTHKLWRVARHAVQRRWGEIPTGIDTVIAVSQFSLDRLAAYLPHHAQVRLVGNPIDVDRTPAVAAATNRPFVMIGRLAPEKGALLLAEAAGQTGLPVTFIGEGPDEAALRHLCPEATFSDGWASRDQVLSALGGARALVFPSRLYEVQGLTVLEAAARGIPSVVSDGCAARDQVIDGQTGLWFRAGDVDDLAAKMRLLTDDALVERLGRAAYQGYWSEPWTMARHIDRLTEVLTDMLVGKVRR
ncbi:MAG: glycosyltransferase family 4 protein [Candidatus Sericytochromatia bacterium]|nr:glycosyltransferase family 4 protein [Candidatus Sericytochromatia bacterium]